MKRVGRATVAAALVFIASLGAWILQRPEEAKINNIPWPDVSWVIVTTTSTIPKVKDDKPNKTTTSPLPLDTVTPSTPYDTSLTSLPETQTTAVAEVPFETPTTAVS